MTKEMHGEAKSLFESKCKSDAGVKIFQSVPDVEGVFLLKTRPSWGDRELRDPMWSGAAFANESSGDEYIGSFLGFEQSSEVDGKPLEIASRDRGYITRDRRSNSKPGYRFVEAIDPMDGKRYRYELSEVTKGKMDVTAHGVKNFWLKKDPNADINIYKWVIKRELATTPPPRYGVTFEDYVVPTERRLWVAGGKVAVLDLQTNQVLGEMVQYKQSWGSESIPWARGPVCPGFGQHSGAYTRKFVDQVLIPSKDSHDRYEADWWGKAAKRGDAQSINEYIDRFAKTGRFLAEARRRLQLLEAKEIQARSKTTSSMNPIKLRAFKDCEQCPEMIEIPAGSFEMGSLFGDGDERPKHTVKISKPFAMARTEVTQRQWKAIMGANPSSNIACGDDCPVENVTFSQANQFLSKVSQLSGHRYRLPSEAEWEYACRSGREQKYCGGDQVESAGWTLENSDFSIHPVGQKQPNAWGLLDMTGNVWEWVRDCYIENYQDALGDASARTRGECNYFVIRGGAANAISGYGRSSGRVRGGTDHYSNSGRDAFVGFRPVRDFE